MNEKLKSRLSNYKFDQALLYLEGEDEDVQEVVKALAETFGSVGWGLTGHMGVIVEAALRSIGASSEESVP